MQKNNYKDISCISLIGMPGVGKSTLGLALANLFEFIHVDTDYILESLYGVSLQTIADNLSKNKFLDLESENLQKLRIEKAIISTGGSVVYRDKGMQALKELGPIVFLSAELDLILKRIALNPKRGLAIAPNQTIEDLYNERMALYTKYADYTIHIDAKRTPESLAYEIYKLFT